MAIDMMDVRNYLVLNVEDKVYDFTHSDAFVGELGGAVLALGVILGMAHLIRAWIKRKGYRMVVRDRNDKIHALLLNILQDGLDKAVEDGKISHQELDRTFAELVSKLGLNDLVPKKRIARQVKAGLKAAQQKRRLLGETKPKIPGDKPPRPVPKEIKPQRTAPSSMTERFKAMVKFADFSRS
jgi:hypothetical protein